jgi:putative ABC transport system permease protein
LLIAVFGAVLGVTIGLAFGSLFLVLAAVIGVLAAVWPGARAARTPALEAIATG